MKNLFEKVRTGWQNTRKSLVHEIKRILTRSPKVTEETLEELEAVLIGADFGTTMTRQILDAVKRTVETQGKESADVLEVARSEVEKGLLHPDTELRRSPDGVTVISLVGVNGTGKTTTAARLAYRLQSQGNGVVLACCDTFRAAAIEQLQKWGERIGTPVIAGQYRSDPAAVAHDAITAAVSRQADYLIVDTAGRLHTKSNLMQELEKLHRVVGRKMPEAPHEVLLVIDGTTGMNALSQARQFHHSVPLTGLVVTKLDGTSKGGIIVGIQKELGLPVKLVGLGEEVDSLQPFDPYQYAGALFSE